MERSVCIRTAQHRVTMAYAHGRLMLAIDRRIFDTPLEEGLQSLTSDLVAWATSMLPVIRHNISEAQKQLRTSHRDIRTYFSDTAAPERTMRNVTLATATATTTTTNRIGPRPTAIRKRPQQTRNQPAMTSTDIRKSRHHDIRTYFSATIAVVTTPYAMQVATEEPTTSTVSAFSRLRTLRSRFQQPRTQSFRSNEVRLTT
jgi:hypothetical protein